MYYVCFMFLPILLPLHVLGITWVGYHTPLNASFNWLDNKFYPKPTTLSKFELLAPVMKIDKDYRLDFPGYYVPYQYDCLSWGPYYYRYQVATRIMMCKSNDVLVRKRVRFGRAVAPMIDDEFMEYTYTLHSTLLAKHRKDPIYVVCELGARWGTWGFRALRGAEILGLRAYAVFFETEPIHCEGIRTVAKKNKWIEGKNYSVICSAANASQLIDVTSKFEIIHLLDLDIQAAEEFVLPQIKKWMDKKVLRIILGTHTPKLHESMQDLLSDWDIHSTYPMMAGEIVFHLWKENPDTELTFREKRYVNTTSGPVTGFDGEIVADNPRYPYPSSLKEIGWPIKYCKNEKWPFYRYPC